VQSSARLTRHAGGLLVQGDQIGLDGGKFNIGEDVRSGGGGHLNVRRGALTEEERSSTGDGRSNLLAEPLCRVRFFAKLLLSAAASDGVRRPRRREPGPVTVRP